MTPGAFKINKNCGHCHGVDVMATSLLVPVEIQMRERGQEDCPRRTDDLRHLILCLLGSGIHIKHMIRKNVTWRLQISYREGQ